MKKTMTIWTVVLVMIVAGLTIIGFKMKEDNKGNFMEQSLVEQGKKYLGLYPGLYPARGDELTLTAEKLTDEGYEVALEEGCTGYLIVKNENSGFKYEPYVSCTDYKTDGYLE